MLLSSLLISLLITQIHTSHWSGNILYDLEFQGLNFETEAQSWSCSAPLVTTGTKTSQCALNTVLGGYNIMGPYGQQVKGQYWSKTYTDLPTHNSIKIQIKIFPIDSWDVASDSFDIYLDTNYFPLWKMSMTQDPSTSSNSTCGDPSFPEPSPFIVYLTIPHTSTTLLLKIVNQADEASNNESLGFRDIILTFLNEATPLSNTYCGVTTSGYPLLSNACPCGTGTSMTSTNSGVCGPCDSSCATCNAAGASSCTSCAAGKYLTSTGSCVQCTSHCAKCSGAPDFCLSCDSGYYLVGSSCYPSCDSPLIKASYPGGVNYCESPCPAGKYAYWNSTCSTQCDSPLDPQTVSTYQVCNFPCSSKSLYLYTNGTCAPNCPLPLLALNHPDVSFCFLPCSSPNIYWYKNASCLPTCNYPYLVIPYSGVLQCLSPCQKSSDYYYENDKKCYPECESPYEKQLYDVIKVCHLDIAVSLGETKNAESTANNIKSQGEYTSGGMKAASAIASNNPGSALLGGLSAMLQYIRYMKVNYPPKVQILFLLSARNPITLGFDFDIPDYIQERFDDYPLPDVFEKYSINSNFVNNLWDVLGTLLLILLIIFGIILLEKILTKCPKVHLVFTKILQLAKWNLPIMLICSSSGDIFFYSSLQFQTLHLNSTASVICFLLSLLMLGSVVFIFGVILFIVRSFHLKKSSIHSKKPVWKGYEILYVDYEEKSLLSLSYMALFIVRGAIFNLTIANLYNFPLTQSIIINFFNLLMFAYILYFRPLKDLINVAQLFITEGMLNGTGISVLILAIQDKMGSHNQETRNGIGNVILFIIKSFNILALVFMGIGLLSFLISAYRIWKRLNSQGIKSPFAMLGALLSEEPKIEKAMIPKLTLSTSTSCSSMKMSVNKRPKILKRPRRQRPIVEGSSTHVINIESNIIESDNNCTMIIQDNHLDVSTNLFLQISGKNGMVSLE